VVMVLGLGMILASPDAPKDSTSMPLQHGDGVRVAYTSSGPIAISSDADFVSQGWPGSGTAADPYRIENLSIVTSSSTAINVSSTTAYFVIKNCLIQNSSSVDLTTGIALKDNAHGVIRDCIVENKHDGIYINGSNETALDNNTFLGVMVSAMYVQWASGLSITNSTVSLDANRGVTLEYVDDVEISHNLFNNTDYGIYSYYGDNLSIFSNTILPSSSSGVYVYWTSNVTAYDNYVTAINSAGLIFCSSDSLNVTRNTVLKAHASGIIAQYSDHVDMSFNTIGGSTYGITLSRITNGSIRGSVISGCTLYGLYLDQSLGTQLYDNTIAGSGIYVYGPSLEYYVVEESNNTVNGKSFGYFLNRTNTIVDGSKFGQIMLVNSTGMRVSGGFFENVPTRIEYSNQTTLSGMTMVNTYRGLSLDYSPNITVIDLSVSNATTNGVGAFMADNLTIQDSHFEFLTGIAVQLESCSHATVVNTTIQRLNNQGISLSLSPFGTIANNTVDDCSSWGISVTTTSYNATVLRNTVRSCTGGVFISSSHNFTMRDNTVVGNSAYGVKVAWSNHVHVSNTTSILNNVGLYSVGSDNGTYMNNTVMSNGDTGIGVDGTSDYGVFVGNLLGWNGINAEDASSTSAWDDNVSRGNAWSDYNGTGVYPVGGTGGRIDHYPVGIALPVPPFISQPENMTVTEDTIGNVILWEACSLFPDWYTISRNTTLLNEGEWNGSNISLNIDGLEVGMYNFAVVVYDRLGLTNSSSVIVTVVDTTAPSLDSPPDITYEVGTTGHQVVWTAADHHPGSHTIYRNGTVVASGNWSVSTTIPVSIDGLSLGLYNFTIVVTDLSGNLVVDTVWVTVRDTTPPSLTSPADVTYVMGAVGHVLQWNVSDLFPAGYRIYRNGTVVMSGEWTDSVSLNVDYLMVGTYNFTLVVWDGSGNTAADTVIVTVVPYSTTSTSSTTETTATSTSPTTSNNSTTTPLPTEPMVPAWALGVVAGVFSVVILVLLVLLRRR